MLGSEHLVGKKEQLFCEGRHGGGVGDFVVYLSSLWASVSG